MMMLRNDRIINGGGRRLKIQNEKDMKRDGPHLSSLQHITDGDRMSDVGEAESQVGEGRDLDRRS